MFEHAAVVGEFETLEAACSGQFEATASTCVVSQSQTHPGFSLPPWLGPLFSSCQLLVSPDDLNVIVPWQSPTLHGFVSFSVGIVALPHQFSVSHAPQPLPHACPPASLKSM